MRKSNPEYWDYRTPRTAEEYIKNNIRRDRRKRDRMVILIKRLCLALAILFIWAVPLVIVAH